MKVKVDVVDFETKKIEPRAVTYPPIPAGVAIMEYGKQPRYYSWGHPCENNCTKSEAKKALKKIYSSRNSVAFHNAKFDLEVAEEHFGLRLLDYDKFEDTMLLAYLRNPRELDLKLKNISDRWLNLPPDEQDELKDWLINHVPAVKRSPTKWGEYISEAPGKLVGKYAKGDVFRTRKLFDLFHPYIAEQGMQEAYDIEKKILKIILNMEKKGIPVDVPLLKKDLVEAKKLQKKSIKYVYNKLGKEINLGSRPQVVEAFEKVGLVKKKDWILTEPTEKMIEKARSKGETPVGNERIGIEHLSIACKDKKIVECMQLNSKLTKLMGTYMEPWLASAKDHGVFYPWFNQTRGDNDHGTKSGRFSSNFQQTPKKQFTDSVGSKLPFMKNYIIGDSKKHCVLGRDYMQQEIRILAYFEDGLLHDAYVNDPYLDVHTLVKDLIHEISGLDLDRETIVKTINFLIVYGGGAPALMRKTGVSEKEARKILRAHSKALPGVRHLANAVMKVVKKGNPIYTAGGREYFTERGFEYKMLNMLIQGSAADHSKRSMIRIDEAFQQLEETRIMITVHDEFIVSTPNKLKKKAMITFRDAMDDDDLFIPIPMLSDGRAGKSWGASTTYEPK